MTFHFAWSKILLWSATPSVVQLWLIYPTTYTVVFSPTALRLCWDPGCSMNISLASVFLHKLLCFMNVLPPHIYIFYSQMFNIIVFLSVTFLDFFFLLIIHGRHCILKDDSEHNYKLNTHTCMHTYTNIITTKKYETILSFLPCEMLIRHFLSIIYSFLFIGNTVLDPLN